MGHHCEQFWAYNFWALNKNKKTKSTWIHFLWLKIFVKKSPIYKKKSPQMIVYWFRYDFNYSISVYLLIDFSSVHQKKTLPTPLCHHPPPPINSACSELNVEKKTTTKNTLLYINNSSISKCIFFFNFTFSFRFMIDCFWFVFQKITQCTYLYISWFIYIFTIQFNLVRMCSFCFYI